MVSSYGIALMFASTLEENNHQRAALPVQPLAVRNITFRRRSLTRGDKYDWSLRRGRRRSRRNVHGGRQRSTLSKNVYNDFCTIAGVVILLLGPPALGPPLLTAP